MIAEDLAVWMEAVDPSTLGEVRPGLLCTRHADAMVVPKGWTLDDRREPVPRLFRIPQRPSAPSRPTDSTARLRRPRHEDWARLALFDDADPTDAEGGAAGLDEAGSDETVADETVADDVGLIDAAPDAVDEREEDETTVLDPTVAEPVVTEVAGSTAPEAWRPQFDQSDDLDGLLTARSPLLRRAFGLPEGDDGRPR
jgi:hypothetical protein